MTETATSDVDPAAAGRGKHAVFIDKDGTLIDDVPYNVDPMQVTLTPGAGHALALLAGAGFRLLVVSNQPGVAYGRFAGSALRAVEDRIQELLAASGVAIEAFYYCPHAPFEECHCRKPAPGMIRAAAAERGIDIASSWLVGDILDDVEAARRAGCRAALIANGNETEWLFSELRIPTIVAGSLAQAARAIVASRQAAAEPPRRRRHAGALVGRH